MTIRQIVQLGSTAVTHSDKVWFEDGCSVGEGPVAHLHAPTSIVQIDDNSVAKYRLDKHVVESGEAMNDSPPAIVPGIHFVQT